jgi:soluble lytic murein transglycosylase
MDFVWRWRRWLLPLILVGAALWLFEHHWVWRENSHDAEILAASRQYGIPPALVKAVVWKESRFDPNARGTKGEIGLMQIMPATAADWARAEKIALFTHTDLFSPARNTRCGAWYLRKLLLRYPQADDALPYALADYNAGRGNVLRWMQGEAVTNSAAFIGRIGFPTTQDYVRQVAGRFQHYRPIFPPPSANP